MRFREKIKKTKSYKSLSFIQRKMIINRNNIIQIESGYNVAKNLGFDQWEKQGNFSQMNKGVIKELVE